MDISTRLQHLTPGGDDGWGLFYRARDMVAAGEPVIELTIGEHDIPTDRSILDAMHASAVGGHVGYAAVPGIPALRQAVAARVQAQTGVPTGPENVLVTPGGQAALFAAHMVALDPGDRAAFIDPYYATYPGTLRAAGGDPVRIVTRAEDGFCPTADVLAQALPGCRSLLINTPNNPTGAVYGADTMAAIADAANAQGLWLISDEVYDTQVWTGRHISPRALPRMAERTLVVGSMSKSHAMTGSRLGWLVGPAEAIAAAVNLATHTTYGVPGFIQDAAIVALQDTTGLEARIAEPFQRRRNKVLALIAVQSVVQSHTANGAMFVMLDVRATGLSGADFADALLDTHRGCRHAGRKFRRSGQRPRSRGAHPR